MIVLVRRVLSASVIVNNETVSSIDKGLLLYVGLAVGDGQQECDYFAKKVANIRIFDPIKEGGKEVSVQDINGQILSVSQFTLSADTKKGNRPSYTKAMPSADAQPLFEYFNQKLSQESGLPIQTGVFGADMTIPAVDDGPFSIIITKE